MFALAMGLVSNGSVRAQGVVAPMPSVNGVVDCMASVGRQLYIGGFFSSIGPSTGAFASIDTTAGWPQLPYAQVKGKVLCAIPDGHGGWYVGGVFTAVAGLPRANAAHLRADGLPDSYFAPIIDGAVRALALQGSTLYAGGDFTHVNGAPRTYLAALASFDGATLSFAPTIDNSVHALALTSDRLIVGGAFQSVNGSGRSRLTDFYLATSTRGGLSLPLDGTVRALLVQGDTLVVAGEFSQGVEQISLSLAAALPWSVNANAAVYALSRSGPTLYLAGAFTNVGGFTHQRLAAVDFATGNVSSWSPGAPDTVWAVLALSDRVVAGGKFTGLIPQGGFGPVPRTWIGAVGLDGQLCPMKCFGSGPVYCLGFSAGRLQVGGDFFMVTGYARSNAAAYDLDTGAITSWAPVFDSYVHGITSSGDTLYFVGNFHNVNGLGHYDIAAVDTSGNVLSWSPSLTTASSWSVVMIAGEIVVAGQFFFANGVSRTGLAALDPVTGALDPWNPVANGGVFSLLAMGDTLWVGGNGFTTMNGQSRQEVCAFDMRTHTLLPFNPGADDAVGDFATDGTTIYVGGSFGTIAGQTRHRLAAFDRATGSLLPLSVTPGGAVTALLDAPGQLLVGSNFGQQGRAAILDPSTGVTLSASPIVAGGVVTAFARCGDQFFAGGGFTSVDSFPQHGLARIVIHTTAVPSAPRFQSDLRLRPRELSNGRTLELEVESGTSASATILVMDVQGRVLARRTSAVHAGRQLLTVSGLRLNSGLILVRMESAASVASCTVPVVR